MVISVLNRTYNLMVMDMPNGLYRDFGSLNVLNGSILENLCAQIRSRVWEATRICRADSEGGKGMDIGKLYSKYKDVLFYLFFGVCTGVQHFLLPKNFLKPYFRLIILSNFPYFYVVCAVCI